MSLFSAFVKDPKGTVKKETSKAKSTVKKTVKKATSSKAYKTTKQVVNTLNRYGTTTTTPTAINLFASAGQGNIGATTPGDSGGSFSFGEAARKELVGYSEAVANDPWHMYFPYAAWHRIFGNRSAFGSDGPDPIPDTTIEPPIPIEMDAGLSTEALAGLGEIAEWSAETSIDMAQELNPAMAKEFYKALEAALPGWQGMRGDMMSYVRQLMSGELPQDVQQYMEMILAEQGIQGGIGGSDIGRRLVARDLGRTSLDLMGQGFQSASSLAQTATQNWTAPTMDMPSMAGMLMQTGAQYAMLSPADKLRADMFNAEQAYQHSVNEVMLADNRFRMTEERRMFNEHERNENTRAVAEAILELGSKYAPMPGASEQFSIDGLAMNTRNRDRSSNFS